MYVAIVSLVFGAASYYFFTHGHPILGGLFLLWCCLGLLGEPVGNFFGGIALVNRDYHVERDCNVYLELGINVEEVVQHPSVVRLFARLREKNFIGDFKALMSVVSTLRAGRKAVIFISQNQSGNSDLL